MNYKKRKNSLRKRVKRKILNGKKPSHWMYGRAIALEVTLRNEFYIEKRRYKSNEREENKALEQ